MPPKINKVEPQYVVTVPRELEQGVLYISKEYRVAIHLCCCGCGLETVTPLSSSGWTLAEENNLVSLAPSIGNFQYACKSHYFITRNEVRWC